MASVTTHENQEQFEEALSSTLRMCEINYSLKDIQKEILLPMYNKCVKYSTSRICSFALWIWQERYFWIIFLNYDCNR